MDAPAAFASFVDLGIRARGQRFEVAANLGFAGEGMDLCEVGGDALIEAVKAPEFLEAHAPVGVGVELVEHGLQFGPCRPACGQESGQIDDHINCIAFTFTYWLTSRAESVSFSRSEKRTPRRWRTFSNSRKSCHSRWPPSFP